MFTTVCSFVAVSLAAFSCKEWRIVAWVVALEFASHKLAYLYLALDFRAENGWAIFMIYATINLIALSLCRLLKSHFFIAFLIFLNMSYNLLTTFGYFDKIFISLYFKYDAFINTIMVLELIYLGMLCKYVPTTLFKLGVRVDNLLDRLFCVGTRYNHWNLA